MWTTVLLVGGGQGGGHKWRACYEGFVVVCKGRERQSCCSVLHCIGAVWLNVNRFWNCMSVNHTQLGSHGN